MQNGRVISLDVIGPRIFIPGYITPPAEVALEALCSLQRRESESRPQSFDLFRKQAHEVVQLAKKLGYDSCSFSYNQESAFRSPDKAEISLKRSIHDDSNGITESIIWHSVQISIVSARIGKGGAVSQYANSTSCKSPACAMKIVYDSMIPSDKFEPTNRYCIAKPTRRDSDTLTAIAYYDSYPKKKLQDGEVVVQYSGVGRTHAPSPSSPKTMIRLGKIVVRRLDGR